MAETVQNFYDARPHTTSLFIWEKNHWSHDNILINLKTRNHSIFICANHRAGNRDSPLSTPKDCSHLSNKKLRSPELGICWFWFISLKIGWALIHILSPSSDHTSLSLSLFLLQSQGSLLQVRLAGKNPLTVLPLVKYFKPVMNTSIPAGGEQWKEETEFSSVAGIPDNQVQN